MSKNTSFNKIIHFSTQFSAVLTIIIVKIYLNSIFTNDLKRKYFFRKMFIVKDLVSLRQSWHIDSLGSCAYMLKA